MTSSPFQQPSSHPFEARFPGICEECGEEFEAGEQVAYYFGKLAHAFDDNCIVLLHPDEKKACMKCFLIHAGDCF